MKFILVEKLFSETFDNMIILNINSIKNVMPYSEGNDQGIKIELVDNASVMPLIVKGEIKEFYKQLNK